MSLYEMHRLIHGLNVHPTLVERFRAAPTEVLAEYALDDAERTALAEGDLEGLWRMGVHPLMMLHYARTRGLLGPDFYRRLQSLTGLRRLASARAGQSSLPRS